MSKYLGAQFLKKLRNDISIDAVIGILNLDVKSTSGLLRFRCPVCYHFHTATNHKTNLARCFDCRKNFNPIDMVIAVNRCSFLEAVQILEEQIA